MRFKNWSTSSFMTRQRYWFTAKWPLFS